jgi:DNA-binding transcriptional MerR regulator
VAPVSQYLSPSDAAIRLGVSAKALRLYEERGLLQPGRNPAGWRVYGPHEMARAMQIVALRRLGLSLGQMARILDGDATELETALADQQTAIERQIQDLAQTSQQIGRMRSELLREGAPTGKYLANLSGAKSKHAVGFDLPWPWGGERFELEDIHAIQFIVGPLGSGKTRFAIRLAEARPQAQFVGLDRLEEGGADAKRRIAKSPEAIRGSDGLASG